MSCEFITTHNSQLIITSERPPHTQPGDPWIHRGQDLSIGGAGLVIGTENRGGVRHIE
jgi:hypothetical protein